jgi:hypothetical protein
VWQQHAQHTWPRPKFTFLDISRCDGGDGGHFPHLLDETRPTFWLSRQAEHRASGDASGKVASTTPTHPCAVGGLFLTPKASSPRHAARHSLLHMCTPLPQKVAYKACLHGGQSGLCQNTKAPTTAQMSFPPKFIQGQTGSHARRVARVRVLTPSPGHHAAPQGATHSPSSAALSKTGPAAPWAPHGCNPP